MEIFTYTLSPRFRQTDSAGLLYFNEAFNLFHDAYEEWAEQLYGSKARWFANEEWAVPLKKASADFRRPLHAFDPCEVKINLASVGNTSFQLLTEIWQKGTLCCSVDTVHVFIDKNTKVAQGIPKEVRKLFEG